MPRIDEPGLRPGLITMLTENMIQAAAQPAWQEEYSDIP